MVTVVLLAIELLGSTPVELVREVARATAQERDVQVQAGIAWTKRIRTWNIKDPASPVLEMEEEFIVWRTPDGTLQKLIRKNGKPASGKPKPPDTEAGTLGPDRYEYRWNAFPKQELDGHPCWVLDFVPLSPLPEAKNIHDDIALQLAGTIWIDRERLFVRRVEAKLHAPFKRKFLDALSAKDAKAVLTNQDVDGHIVPAHAEMSVWHSLAGFDSAQRKEFDYYGVISGFVPPSP